MNLLQPWHAVFLVGLVIYIGIRHSFIKRLNLMGQTKAVSRLDFSERLLLAAMSVSILALPLVFFLTPLVNWANYRLPPIVPWLGLVAMGASLWLFWRSHADLGENWSVSLEIREGHALVTHGVYRSMRHPMYASIWLWVLAQGMMLSNWLAGWSALLAFAAMYFLRLPREEQMMTERFGEEYRQYMRRTGRIFPRINRGGS